MECHNCLTGINNCMPVRQPWRSIEKFGHSSIIKKTVSVAMGNGFGKYGKILTGVKTYRYNYGVFPPFYKVKLNL